MQRTSASAHLAKIIESGRTAQAFIEHRAVGFDAPHNFTRKPAVGSGELSLRDLYVMPPASATAHAYTYDTTPVVPNSSKSIGLDAAIIQNCLVAHFGASIIVAAERNIANTNTLPVFYKDVGLFRIVEPAPFGAVADGANAAIGAAPWSDSLVEWSDVPSIAFNVIFPRAVQKGLGGGALLEENILEAIILGLAEAADRTLLAAITAANPAPFNLAAAAARGLRFENLGALIGTNGAGASVGTDGTLRASGIAAKLTRTASQTVIGDFNKAAVAISPDIQLHYERLNANGDMACVCFANMQALVPDATAFWLAGN